MLGCAAAVFLSLFFAPTIWASLPMSAAVLAMGAGLARRGTVPSFGRGESVVRLCWAAGAAGIFVHRFLDTLREQTTPLPGWCLVILGAAGFAALLYFFFQGFSLFDREDPPAKENASSGRLRIAEWGLLLFTAAAVITLCSKSSPIYPLNDWADSNCYFTVGKAMARGKVLYRDIYEQKGILLYLLHTAAYYVSPRSFLGVWLWEIAAAWAFLLFAYKTLRLYAPERVIWLLPILAAVIYTVPCFVFGDLAEEFCLPLLGYALYAGARAIREDRALTRREWLWVGITSAGVLWIKYSMVAFYLGWVLVPAAEALRRRDWRALGRMVGFVGLGVGLVTVPVIAYFAVHRALGDLFTAYFYNNIFLYHREGSQSFFYLVLRNLMNTFQGAAPMYGAILLSLPWLLQGRNRRLGVQVLLGMIALCLGSFNANHLHTYYAFILCVFAPLAGWPCLELWDALGLRAGKTLPRAAALVAAGLIVLLNGTNFYLLAYDKADIPQYRFAAILERYEDPTLLNYRFLDGGFYTVTGIVPSEKYFCALNVSLPEITEQQDQCVREGRADFLVTMDRNKDYPLYERIAEQTFPPEGDNHTYRLYIRKDLLSGTE